MNFLLLAILFLYVQSNITAQECLPEGIKFITQDQIDSFPINHPECFGIKGDVVIEERTSGTILNLDGLSQISSIGGNLKLWKNASLNNLDGLKNLNSIGGFFDVYLNSSLKSLKGLENLSLISEYIKVSNNESLISLRGLDNIKSVHSSLSIRSNISLLSLEGLEKLQSIKGAFSIVNNELLPNLNELNELTSIGSFLLIYKNNSLFSLDGLENLTTIGGCLSIRDNPDLINLDGLSNLNSILECLEIHHNSLLENLNGLKNLTSIGKYLKVHQNISLISLTGLKNIEFIGGFMDVYNNPSLLDKKELKHLNPVGKIIKRKYKKKKNTKMWISTIDKSSKYKGYLRGIEDSIIILSHQNNKLHDDYRTQNIDVTNIKTIKYRKKGKIGRSILYGALTGFTIGALMGLASGDDDKGFIRFSAEAKAIGAGTFFSIPGALIGGIIGSAKVKIPINGNHRTMKNQKGKLMDIMLLE